MLTTLCSLLGILLICYFAGHVLLSLVDNDRPAAVRLFLKLALGATVLATLYALIRTGGQTLLLGVVPLLAIGAYRSECSFRGVAARLRQIEWLELGLTAVAAALFWSGQLLLVWNQAIHPDYSFYAAVGSFLDQTAVETPYLDWANTAFQAPALYHYGEIWLSVLAGHLFGLTQLTSLVMVAFPLLLTLFYAGGAALAQSFFRLATPRSYLTALLLPIVGIVGYYFHDNFALYGYAPFGSWSVQLQKFLPVGIALAASMLAQNDSLLWRIWPLCVASLLYAPAAPALLAGCGLWLLIRTFRKERTCQNGYLCGIVVTLFTLGHILLFYALNGIDDPYKIESLSALAALKESFAGANGWRVLPENFAQRLIPLLLNAIPYLLLIPLLGREKRTALWRGIRQNGLYPLILLVSLAGSTALWFLVDNIQLTYSVSLPLLQIGFFLLLAHAVSPARGWQWLAPAVLVVFNLLILSHVKPGDRFDAAFYRQVERTVDQPGNYAYLETYDAAKRREPFFRNANYVRALPDLRRYTDRYLPVNLSVYDIPYDTEQLADQTYVLGSIETGPFYRFVEQQQLADSLWEAQNRFIRQHEIRFVVAQRGMESWFAGRPFRVERIACANREPYEFYRITPIQ